MSLLDDIDRLAAPKIEKPKLQIVAPGTRPHPGNFLGDLWGRKAPGRSADLERILKIPRRPRPTDEEQQAMVELMTRRLRVDRGRPCRCADMKRKCILRLKPAQAWALYEMGLADGLLGPIVVGGGKTGLDILAAQCVPSVKTAVLIVPPKLVEQLKNEYLLWAEHWRVPSLLARGGYSRIMKGEPAVHVVPTSILSQPRATNLLQTLNPDLLIVDEAHHFKYASAVRTGRFLSYFRLNANTRLCAWSGSLTDKSVRDYAHLSGLALGPASPLPIDETALAEWAAAIDPPAPGQDPGPIGALSALCEVGETLRSGYRRRLLETCGVVATDDPGIGASLYMHERPVKDVPTEILEAINQVRLTWMRPDGDELVEAFAVALCARTLAEGFFYRWIFPRGEPVSLILEWFAARKAWHKEVREKLKRRQPHLDQPLLLARAAMRFYDPNYDGDLPVWESESWPAWVSIREKVKPESEAVWISDYLARDAADWALKHRGIVWYEHAAFGKKVAELSGLPLHSGGPDAEARIRAEKGDRSIIASIRSHGEGRDGLQFLFKEQLVANPPVSKQTGGAGRWEQLLGRLHREGQEADEIDTYIYRHTDEMQDAWDRALELARYVSGTTSNYQKLLACSSSW